MKSKPKVSIIVTHHLNINDKYLETCLQGLRYSRGINFEVKVMSSAEVRPEISNSFMELYWDPNLDTATKKITLAMNGVISPDSTHVLFLSDDVILSQDCIAYMYYSFRNRHMIMSPMSNSDLMSRYEADLFIGQGVGKILLKPDMKLEEFSQPHLEQIIKFKAGRKILVRTDWVCFYSVMMTKPIWSVLQGYDQHLEYRHNDQDFCMRASKLGIPSVINLGAFAFHFGSRTMNYVEETERQKCTEHFMNKWKFQ